jgi:hypothetical protein
MSMQSPNYPPPPGSGYPQPGGPQAELPRQQPAGTSGLAVTGFILAFLLAPIGFILSLIGLVTASRRGQKGKGLAISGIIVSLVLMIGAGVVVYAVAGKVATLTDPGCTVGKAAVLDNESLISSPSTLSQGIRATIDGLDSAAAKANHDNVRTAVKALADDYRELQKALDSKTAPSAALQSKLETDGKAIDSLCSLSTAK